MSAWFNGQPLPEGLTAKDLDVLAYLSEQAGRVCTHEEIGGRFWGPDYDPGALYKFMSRLKAKLPADLAAQIVNVRGVGYRLDGPAFQAPTITRPREGVVDPSRWLAVVLIATGLLVAIALWLVMRPGPPGTMLAEDFNAVPPAGYSKNLLPFTPINYAGGELVLRKEADAERRMGFVAVAGRHADSSLSLDMRFVSDASGRWAVLGCRRDNLSTARAASSYYLLSVSPSTGKVRLGFVDDGREMPLSSVTTMLLRPGEWNRIELVCDGGYLTAKVNGFVVLSAYDSVLASGHSWFGVVTDTPGMDAEVRLDNLTLRPLP
jgi:hypothetical protein